MKDFSDQIIDDDFIIANFIDKNGNVSGPKCKCIPANPNVKSYLENRFPDFRSIDETIYRILNNIEEIPRCPICGKPCKYRPVKHYLPTCGDKSCIYENTERTFENRYGGRSGFGNTFSSDKIKGTLLEKFGVDNAAKSQEVWDKIQLSNKAKSSKEENQIFEVLKDLFPSTLRNVKTEEYPFYADFYIPEYSLYIEYHGSMFHHGRRFNAQADLQELDRLKSKCNQSKPNRYNAIVYTWTDLDPRKLETVKENNVNCLVIYPFFLGNRNKSRYSNIDICHAKKVLSEEINKFKGATGKILVIGEKTIC